MALSTHQQKHGLLCIKVRNAPQDFLQILSLSNLPLILWLPNFTYDLAVFLGVGCRQ